MPRRPDLAPFVEKIGPPVSRAPWSSDFVVQAVEVLPMFLTPESIVWLKPVHAESLQVGLAKGAKAAEVVLEAIGWYELQPRVVHSTSWREAHDRIVLTYLVVVDTPGDLPADSLVGVPVERAELARVEAMGSPGAIAVAAVIEHALRHLKWLLGDDPAVRRALPEWAPALAGYDPEPFRALA
jgi:hypothetical protein